ncbi:hypothetical protein GCM10027074_52140 [Streptomyces deserti]
MVPAVGARRLLPHCSHAWVSLKGRLDSPEPHSYKAYEFSSAEGRTLLYCEEFC